MCSRFNTTTFLICVCSGWHGNICCVVAAAVSKDWRDCVAVELMDVPTDLRLASSPPLQCEATSLTVAPLKVERLFSDDWSLRSLHVYTVVQTSPILSEPSFNQMLQEAENEPGVDVLRLCTKPVESSEVFFPVACDRPFVTIFHVHHPCPFKTVFDIAVGYFRVTVVPHLT